MYCSNTILSLSDDLRIFTASAERILMSLIAERFALPWAQQRQTFTFILSIQILRVI